MRGKISASNGKAIRVMPREIVLLEQAAAFLAECQDLDELRSLRDKAEAIRLYQKKIGDSQRSQNAAAAIKVRAERRMGELLAKRTPAPRGVKGRGKSKRKLTDTMSVNSPSLKDLEVSEQESSRCQAIAAIPAEEFEEAVNGAVEGNKELTSKDLVKKGRTHQRRAKKMVTLRALDNATDDPGEARTWEVIHGHCVTVMGHPRYWTPPYEATQSPAISGVRLVVADPPYNEGIDYGRHYDDSLEPGDYLAKAEEWLWCCHQALTDDGSLWLLVNHAWARKLCGLAEEVGLHLRQWLTWYESFGVNCAGKFNLCSRPLLWLVKDPKRFVFNADAPEIRRASDRQAKYNDVRANPDGKLWDDVWGINPIIPRLTGTCKERMPVFPTQLPLALLRPIVACASDPGDLVLDPFSGSGTTGAACIELGRRFIGVELSPEFVELSRSRLKIHEMEFRHAQARG